jgi:D-glycero-alpha-D-manno-heptose-7-phosphate kinase
MIVSRTPLRVSFFGGGSDLPAYYRRHGGAVLSTAIDKAVFVTVNRKFDDAVRVSYSRTEEVPDAASVEHPLVRESLGLLGIEGGVEITSVADIPARGTGLGSSSSFTVGLLNALHAFEGRAAGPAQLAEESCVVEIDRCGEPIGKQDQYAAAFGGINFIRFHADDRVEVEPLSPPAGTLEALQARLLFFYTGVTRSASALLRQQSEEVGRPGAKSDDTAALVRLAETARAELGAGNVEGFGELMHEAWLRKRHISPGVSTPVIAAAYEAARSAGAEGGKVLGAGGGGFLMFIAAPERHAAVTTALEGLRRTSFNIAANGSSTFEIPTGREAARG